MMTTAQRIMMDRAQQYDLLTLSGNEITDYVRTLPDQGDGLSNDGSFGVWPTATNRAINSNFKTNTTSFIDVGATTTRETSGLVGADTTRGSTVTANAATAEGTSQLISGGAAATQYTFSIWVAGTGTIKLYISDSVSGKQLGAQITLSATPTKYSVTATTGAASTDQTVGWETDSQQGITVTHGRWMAQTGAIAMPHVLTDGATAASSAGRIQMPDEQLFTPTQGWMAFKWRRDSTATTSGDGEFLGSWEIDANNRIVAYRINVGSSLASLYRIGGGAGGVAVNAALTAGLMHTSVHFWSADAVNVQCDASAVTSAAQSTIPGLTTQVLDLGSKLGTSLWLSGDILAFACGRRALTKADAAQVNSILTQNGNPTPNMFPAALSLSAVWDGVSGVFIRRR